jgi:hypothetical protein
MKSFTTLLAAGLYLLSGAQAQVNPYGDPLSYGGSPEIMPSRMLSYVVSRTMPNVFKLSEPAMEAAQDGLVLSLKHKRL